MGTRLFKLTVLMFFFIKQQDCDNLAYDEDGLSPAVMMSTTFTYVGENRQPAHWMEAIFT